MVKNLTLLYSIRERICFAPICQMLEYGLLKQTRIREKILEKITTSTQQRLITNTSYS